ncbi:helix-turn-helix transcriptional regulator [Streptomyces sp. NBC_01387]|uniref:helix-turn-helix domain-containing protein n=1 Tax=unclassified Streptomyces TaxID=2593676 RepID=UPI0020251032|nr:MULTISPECIES: helix-turn-helix transcriptional regulator [unclassified Streptomyces]WSV52830.1 helix-turn-helix transcriptional regulator [Streptomyces sp. NBC_01014]
MHGVGPEEHGQAGTSTGRAQASGPRRELGAFLRSRRERLTPGEVGLPGSPRRRTPGLRRSEVAELAGISSSWYAWLEQGRVRTSEQVLRSVARALRLDAAETAHVRSFVEQTAPGGSAPGWVSRNLLSLVEALAPHPAVVLDPHWDLLAWNTGYAALLTDPARLTPKQRNLLWLVFRWQPARTLLTEWEPEARSLLGQFRAKAARHPEDGRYAEITEELLTDPDAARWYDRRETSAFHPAVRHFRHPVVGDLRLRYVKLAAVDEPGHHFLAYLPDDRATEAAVGTLAGEK